MDAQNTMSNTRLKAPKVMNLREREVRGTSEGGVVEKGCVRE
jgi:hypothetical protein